MKKVFTLAICLAFFGLANGQSQRMVLIEEGTNASCGPCAAQNPGFHALLSANTDKAVSIKYQAWYPGYDPMYEHNPDDVHNRLDYYGFEGVPTATLDGEIITASYPGFDAEYYAGAPGGYSQTVINTAYAVPASFDVSADYTLTENSITITANATCTQAVSGNLKYHVVVIEKEITFDSAPGTNGETEFYNVMKKMLPSADGEPMADSYAVGDEFTTTQTWTLDNIYRMDQIAVVVYIQNDDTKEVLQAGEVYKAYHTLDAQSLAIETPDMLCEPTVNPSVTIRNNGATELTSLNINYVLNDMSGTINWTGNLLFDETEVVSLGDITFVPDGTNELEVTISDPNAGTGDLTDNNTISSEVNVAAEATLNVTVEIHTDYYSVETSWDIRNSSGQVVAQDSYTAADANSIQTAEVMLDPFDCHTLTLYDQYGDGMAYGPPGSGPFGYRVIDGNGNVILEHLAYGYNFGSSTVAGLKTEDLVSVNESSINSSVNLFPNPATEQLNIAFELKNADHVTIDIYNLVGQVVSTKDLGMLSSGYTLKQIDVSELSSGFYMVRIQTSDAEVVRKITVSK